MTSNNQLPRDYSMRPKKASRLSSSNAAYYNCRQTISRGSIRQGLLVTGGHRQSLEIRKIWCPETLPQQLLTSGSNFDNSTRILFLMVGILVLILLSTLYLLFRLQSLQEKIDSSYMRASVTFPIEQILGWQNRL